MPMHHKHTRDGGGWGILPNLILILISQASQYSVIDWTNIWPAIHSACLHHKITKITLKKHNSRSCLHSKEYKINLEIWTKDTD